MKRTILFFVLIIACKISISQNTDSLKNLLTNTSKSDTNYVHILLKINRSFKNADSGIIYINKALKNSLSTNYVKGIAESKLEIAIRYYELSNYDTFYVLVNEAYKYSKQNNYLKFCGDSKYYMGLYYKAIGDYAMADSVYNQAIEFYTIVNDSAFIATTYTSLATIYREQGNYEKALENNFKALTINEKIKNDKGVGMNYNNIGNIYFYQEEYEKAIDYYNRSIEIKKRREDFVGMCFSYGNIGSCYSEMKQFDNAILWHSKNYALAKNIKSRKNIAIACREIAEINIKINKLDSVLEYIDEGIIIAKELKNKDLITSLNTRYAMYYNAIKKYNKAFIYADSSLILANELSNIIEIRSAAYEKYIAAENLGEDKIALINYRLYIKMLDSLRSEEVLKKALSKEFAYKEEKLALEQEKKEIEHQAEVERQKLVRNGFIIGFSLMIILALVILNSYRNKKKANMLLSQQNIEIKQQKEEIQTINDQLIDKNEELLQQKEEIQAQAEELIEKNELIENAYNNVHLLSEIGKKITACLDIKTIISTVYDNVNSIMDASVFAIGLYNPQNNAIEFDGAKEKGQTLKFHSDSLENQNQLSVKCYNRQKIIVINNIFTEYNKYFDNQPDAKEGEIPNSLIYLPINSATKKIGVISVQSFKINSYTDYHINMLQNIAIYTSIALENADSFHQINQQKEIIELHSEAIKSSIRYAKTIQYAILPRKEIIDLYFENFILFKPKDVVSGDFYWYSHIENYHFIADIDCTGHGVPGAFMSMIGNTLLNEIVNGKKIFNTADILTNLHKYVVVSLRQETSENNDGMDVCFCRIEKLADKKIVHYTGAKRPLLVYKTGYTEIETIKANRKSIGGTQRKQNVEEYISNEIIFDNGGAIFLSSDGYTDQNNKDRKRFGSQQLSELIYQNINKSMTEQGEIYNKAIEGWMHHEEQRDDITLLGIKL